VEGRGESVNGFVLGHTLVETKDEVVGGSKKEQREE
jgi:hypothetical protein